MSGFRAPSHARSIGGSAGFVVCGRRKRRRHGLAITETSCGIALETPVDDGRQR
jgi:hypothetical protein